MTFTSASSRPSGVYHPTPGFGRLLSLLFVYHVLSDGERAVSSLQGFRMLLTEASKSEALRVTSTKSYVSTVAAMKASIAPIGRPAASLRATPFPQALAPTSLIGKIRPSNRP